MKHTEYSDILSSICMKLMLVVALFIPITTTTPGNKHPQYYQEFVLVNAVAVIFIFFYVISLLVHKRWNRENLVFCVKFFLFMAGYLFFYWMFLDDIQWKWYGVNACVSLGFFFLMMAGRNERWLEKYRIIEFTNVSLIVSHAIGIVVYLAGYASVYWYNFQFQLMPPKDFYGEKRFEWIYYHKSQYAFMVLLGLAFLLVHRKKFRSKIAFGVGLAVMAVSLYISHVNTAIVGGGLMAGSFCIDIFIKNFRKIKTKVKAVLIPAFCVGVVGMGAMALMKIQAERSVLTLGNRTYIWDNAIDLILKRPEGIGNRFSFKKVPLPELLTKVNNGHNIFLNEMLRFSIPVGICFTVLFFLIVAYALEKKFSFFSLGIWGALLMSVMMDYAVMISGWTLMFFFLYMIFFYDTGCKGDAEQTAVEGEQPSVGKKTAGFCIPKAEKEKGDAERL
ncbi:MAG: O-antigen ligase family protein [Eubacteriales bacterium]|nr:O-antigen ligase family protein [Eubacteriales bacterium]